MLFYKPTPYFDDEEGEQILDDLANLFFIANNQPRGTDARRSAIARRDEALVAAINRFNQRWDNERTRRVVRAIPVPLAGTRLGRTSWDNERASAQEDDPQLQQRNKALDFDEWLYLNEHQYVASLLWE
jgi:hypothetical protein